MPAFDPQRPDRAGYQSDWNQFQAKLQELERNIKRLESLDRKLQPGASPIGLAPVPTYTASPSFISSLSLAMPSIFSVLGSPVTSVGNLAVSLATQAANLVFAGPATGAASAPSFRALTAADVPFIPGGVSVSFDGGTSAIAVGTTAKVRIPYSGIITGWTLGADAAGSVVVDVWKAADASYPPTILDTITASAKPTLAAAAHASSTTLAGWTTAVTAGDWLFFYIESAATIKNLLVRLDMVRS